MHLLFALNREARTTLVLVTHNLELAQKTQRIIRLKGGSVIADENTAHQYIEKILAEAI